MKDRPEWTPTYRDQCYWTGRGGFAERRAFVREQFSGDRDLSGSVARNDTQDSSNQQIDSARTAITVR
jgi:hypothetical protein